MPSPASPARRSPWLALLAVLILSLVGASEAGAAGPRQDGGDGEGQTTPVAPSVDPRGADDPTYKLALAHGEPFICGQAAAGANTPEIDCQITGKISIPTKVAKFVGLSSPVLAQGAFGGRTDHYKNSDGDDLGRAYFLTIPSSVKKKLQAKHVKALGIALTGTITVKGSDQISCGGAQKTSSSCAIKAPKRTIWGGEDGALLCWRYMPWYLATPATYGKMCPKPISV